MMRIFARNFANMQSYFRFSCKSLPKFFAKLNIDVIDVGVPVLSMHAPVEVVAKTDIWSSYNAFVAFFKD